MHDFVKSQLGLRWWGRFRGAGHGSSLHIRDFEMIKFVKKEDGLVTIEWIGIAAVMVLAAIAVVTFAMKSTSTTATNVNDKIQVTADAVEDGGGIGSFTPPGGGTPAP